MRKAEEFAKTKNAYLEKKRSLAVKVEPARESLAGVKHGQKSTTPCRNSGVKTASKKGASNSTCQRGIDSLANELIFQIFGHLDVKSLLSCASACRRWETIASDNIFWITLYIQHVYVAPKDVTENFIKEPSAPLEVENKYWKERFFTDSKAARNKKFARLQKTSRYTGITDNVTDILQKLGTKFQLAITTKKGVTFTFVERKRDVFLTSTLLQWYTLKTFPKIKEIKKLEIFSLTPIITQKDGSMLKNGPKHKGLILAEDFNSELLRKTSFVSNDEIETFVTTSGILVSIWKDTDELAFIWATICHHNLINKCLKSTSDKIFHKPHTVKPDDVSRSYGLQGYKIHVQMCVTDAWPWDMQFQSDSMSCCKYPKTVTFAATRDLDQFPYSAFGKKFLSWKTDLFSGKMENLAFMTITITDVNSDVIWHTSRPVKCENVNAEVANFDSFSDSTVEMSLSDGIGKVDLIFSAVTQERFSESTAQRYAFERIILVINLSAVNRWFGTNY